jgi:RecB family exonuclease
MIKRNYIIGPSLSMSKSYCKQKPNIGFTPATVKSFIIELYNHPVFFMENKETKLLTQYELDLVLCRIHQKLDKDNYFYEAMKIRGNRTIVARALSEIKLSVNGDLSSIELEDPDKAKSLSELYSFYCREEIFEYASMVKIVLDRLEGGVYKNILESIEVTPIGELELIGFEKVFFKKIGVEYKESETDVDYSKMDCTSSVTASGNINLALKWMSENSLKTDNTKLVALNYDVYAQKLYQLKDTIPVTLSSGLKCVNFDFYAKYLTKISNMSDSYPDADIFIKKIELMTRAMSVSTDYSDLERCFYAKSLTKISELHSAIPTYKELEISIDPNELLFDELLSLSFTNPELGLDNNGIELVKLEDCYGIESDNIVVLGLENSNYPKKELIDPILKQGERVLINKSVDGILNEKTFYVEDMLDLALSKTKGRALLTYESHNLETGKLVVPSPFFNNVLKSQKRDISLDNIYELCHVQERYTEDLLNQGDLVDLKTNNQLSESINTQTKKLFSKEIEDIDYAENSEFKKELSASSLEMFYKCPYKFNLRANLKVYAPDLAQSKKSHWLGATERGSYLHQVYEDILTPFIESKDDYKSYLASIDEKVIDSVMDKALDAKLNTHGDETFRTFNADIPKHIIDNEMIELKENLQNFVNQEMEQLDEFYPFKLEYNFDYSWMLDGVELNFSGFIDRVDTDGKGNFRVLDYKTGQNKFKTNHEYLFYIYDKKYKSHQVYFQHALYTKAMLESEFKSDINSIEAGYYFSSDVGGWAKVYHKGSNPESKLEAILKTYISEASSGKYFKNADSCFKCDYKQICANKQTIRKDMVEFPQLVTLQNAVENEESEDA